MSITQPATPAKAATPGSNEQGQQPPAAATPQAPATGGQGEQNAGAQSAPPEGMVSITTKEFAELQRNAARLQAFQKRAEFAKPKAPQGTPNPDFDPNDPVAMELATANQAKTEAERELHQLKVKDSVRDLLNKEENKNLPDSTKKLILSNPALLSNANTVEEAMIDIEEFVQTEVASLSATPNQQQNDQQEAQGAQNPEGHETPPAVQSGSPAPTPAEGLEEISNLTGVSRSRAIIRNALKKQKGVQAV